VKPLDPRLRRPARRAVVPVAVLAALGLASAALVIAQAWLLATMIASVFIDKTTLAGCAVPLAALAGVTAGRAAVGWAAQAAAHRASAEATTELRTALLARVLALGPGWRRAPGESEISGSRRDAAALTKLATTGLDGLDGYFTGYLPALIAAVAVPLAALIAITIAVPDGHLGLRTGLLALICALEACLPLRALGPRFRASADGLAAAEEVFAILETRAQTETEVPVPVPGAAGLFSPAATYSPAAPRSLHVDAVSVRHEGRAAPAPDRATFTIEPGRLTVLAGPSGCGKTTLISCLLGFTAPTSGSIRSKALIPNGPVVPAAAPSSAPPERNVFGWLPQDPTLFTGTVAENIRLGWPAAPDEAVAAAARDAALDEVPLTRVLGTGSAGLSAGQRRRVALARALLPGRPVLVLDEPTAGLDAAREAVVIETLRRHAAAGRAVLAVSRCPAVIAAADTLVDLTPSPEHRSAPPPAATSPAATSPGVRA
jgi:ABC-type transport system involved in cytochrome bd biosynthesis fused ATPase/permease subunit